MSWFWRIVAAFGGLTFIVGGIGVASANDCQSVTFGGQVRSSTYTCFPDKSGEFSSALAAAGMLALGTLLMAPLLWPFASRSRRSRQLRKSDGALGVDRMSYNEDRAEQVAEVDALVESIRIANNPKPLPAEGAPDPQGAGQSPVTVEGSWRADPTGRYEHRVWDGSSWTDRVRSNGREFVDPVD